VFRCHQHDLDDPAARCCAGWAHVHAQNPPGHELMALRIAVSARLLTIDVAASIADYRTDVPCFASAAQAADWGTDGPYTEESAAMAAKIGKRRPGTVQRPRRRPGPHSSR
jgi:hypothetical protein